MGTGDEAKCAKRGAMAVVGAAGASGDQMAMALQSIAVALGQMQEAMQSMEGRLGRSDKAIHCVVRRIKVQGAAVRGIDRRVRILEARNMSPILSALSPSAVVLTSASSVTRGRRASPGGRGRLALGRSPSPSGASPSAASRALCEESFLALGKNLLKASQNGRTKQVRELLDAGADINFTCGSQWTPLHRAAAKAHEGVVDLLVDRGANVRARNGYGFTALHIAAYHDFSGQCVISLIEAGSDVNSKNRSGRTPLHYAAESGNVAAVRALLVAGAKVSARDDEGRAPGDVAKTTRVRRLLRGAPHGSRSRSLVQLTKFKLNRLAGAGAGAHTE